MTYDQFSELELLLKLNFLEENVHTLIDVGAHVGFFLKRFAEMGWFVLAFEPEPENYKELCDKYKNYANVICLQKAISDETKKNVPFFVSSEHWGIHSLKPFHKTHQTVVRVNTVRLDEEIKKFSIDHVTVLKIDVEGADLFALKSFDFKQFHPQVVICEFMDSRSRTLYDYTHHDMAEHMLQYGYQVYLSEWGPISEYSRKGRKTAAHKFINCSPYPVNHDIAWGNLICVSNQNQLKFEAVLKEYLAMLKKRKRLNMLKRIPGFQKMYRSIKRLVTF